MTLAWYFSEPSRRLRFGDGRLIRKGVTHSVEGPLELCCKGLHASKRLFDAMEYAPGSILWRVKLSGKIERDDDKMCARNRTYLTKGFDAYPLLSKVRCDFLLEVWPDYCSAVPADVYCAWKQGEAVRYPSTSLNDFSFSGNVKSISRTACYIFSDERIKEFNKRCEAAVLAHLK